MADRERLTPEDAEVLLRRMVDAAMAVVDSLASPAHLTDEQYTALRTALEACIGGVIERVVGVG